jgi:NADH:ubiquinone oxidoreductase subunit E
MNDEDLLKANQIIVGFDRDSNSLIHILQEIQAKLGYVPLESQREVADYLGVPVSKVFGIVSFYNFFKINPPGRHQVHVCMGTACYVKGAEKLIEKIKAEFKIRPGETTADHRFSLEEVRCIGCCAIGPVITVDEDVYGGMTPEKVSAILKKYE